MTYLVTVGLSRSTTPEVLRWAVDQAELRDGRVRVVRAWRPTPSTAGSRGTPSAVGAGGPGANEVAAREELVAEVAQVLGPDHQAEVEVVLGGRRRVLLAETAAADLLVIAAPRLTSASDAPLQVARLVADAGCPVVVLPRKVTGISDSAFVRGAKVIAETVARSAGQSGRPGIRPPARPQEE